MIVTMTLPVSGSDSDVKLGPSQGTVNGGAVSK